MELNELYKLRRSFTIIGLTGRTGSGCSKIAELLSSDFNNLNEGIREISKIESPISRKKNRICYNYLSYGENWQSFEIIKYKNILLFYLISYYSKDYKALFEILEKYFREDKKEDNSIIVKTVSREIQSILSASDLVGQIESYNGDFSKIKTSENLSKLYKEFFGNEFNTISNKIFTTLEKYGYFRRSHLLHHLSCNIRQSGDPLNSNDDINIKYIYTLAELTNRLIKCKKQHNDSLDRPTKIVIDSLRNSLEIMFFKERYSGFYMVSTKDGANRVRDRINDRLEQKGIKEDKNALIKKIIDLDATEYKTSDHSKGIFSSPDVYNCIQKSDIHILNNRIQDVSKESENEPFFTREEQILKFISIILQPGIITPSSSERCMQIAFNAKLNSGCISRQVGAVVTDEFYSIKAVGWNDVPSGQTPCNLRSADDFKSDKPLDKNHYSKFEQGIDLDKVDIDFKYKNKEPHDFPGAIKEYFKSADTSIKNKDLNGKNCSFCFKTIHNHFEGEKNQVHTKSLHAEENAMLQISKYGGQGLKNGILFTTASPCELCSKKATQLGIKKVYYIDPYPGISEPQILSYNRDNNTMDLIQFNGVIGKSYVKLYEPFMAYKDEISIMLENNPKKKTIWENSINDIENIELKDKMKLMLDENMKLDEKKLLDLLK
jgi:deoxycytidylate deaminase